MIDLEMDLSNNEIEQKYYEQIIAVLNDLTSLENINLSLRNNKITKVDFEQLPRQLYLRKLDKQSVNLYLYL